MSFRITSTVDTGTTYDATYSGVSGVSRTFRVVLNAQSGRLFVFERGTNAAGEAVNVRQVLNMTYGGPHREASDFPATVVDRFIADALALILGDPAA